ncbi:MAG: 2-hydroxyacyl-CoA dehydratase family protein [Coriobacteriales bacterium]|nr:2-hydroxyacyl-CoA dehydratase family protein [Coriobacteriales bacterium]
MSYTNEYLEALERIDTNNRGVKGLRYFLDTAHQWHTIFQNDSCDPKRDGSAAPLVVVLGHGIPEQLIYACGTTPLHLLGGSHASCQWSDDFVPRDSDPASRSILGYALKLAENPNVKPLFVVPVTNDNMRKIAYLLARQGHATLPVDIPPTMATSPTQHAWEQSLRSLVKATERHVGIRATARSIQAAERLVGSARKAMVEFERSCIACEGVLNTEARLIVLNSYYQTNSLTQWTNALKELTTQITARHRTLGRPTSNAPRTLVVGSPILFPQYKVAGLLEDAGLYLLATADASSTSRYSSLSARELHGGVQHLIGAIARRHYAVDSSGAHVVNQALEQYVEFLFGSMRVDGVVFHTLKGQIEHDFLYARMEPMLERYDIPAFRLETDYQYQDVEQLRIRLEAFAEMLEQRTFAFEARGTNVRRSA